MNVKLNGEYLRNNSSVSSISCRGFSSHGCGFMVGGVGIRCGGNTKKKKNGGKLERFVRSLVEVIGSVLSVLIQSTFKSSFIY